MDQARPENDRTLIVLFSYNIRDMCFLFHYVV